MYILRHICTSVNGSCRKSVSFELLTIMKLCLAFSNEFADRESVSDGRCNFLPVLTTFLNGLYNFSSILALHMIGRRINGETKQLS